MTPLGELPATSSLFGTDGGKNMVLATEATPEYQVTPVIWPACTTLLFANTIIANRHIAQRIKKLISLLLKLEFAMAPRRKKNSPMSSERGRESPPEIA